MKLKKIEGQKRMWGSEGMLPRKFFENLVTAMAILVLFEQFSSNCLNFLLLILSPSSK